MIDRTIDVSLSLHPFGYKVRQVGVPGREIHVQIFDNFVEPSLTQHEWDDFVESVDGEIFLTFDWCRLWWKYYGDNRILRVFVFRHNNSIVGLIPLFFETIWLGPLYAKVAKIVGSDFTMPQFSLPINPLYMKEVGWQFAASMAEYDWDILHLGSIAGMFEHYDDLKSTLEEFFGDSHFILSYQKTEQIYFKLPQSWDGYLAKLHRKERTKIRRHYRLLYKALGDKEGHVVAKFAIEQNLEDMFADLVQMHQQHWQRMGKSGHFGDWPHARKFHLDVAKAQLKLDRLCLMKVTLGERCLGYKYGYIFGRNYFDFLDARSDLKELANIGLGRIIYSEMFKDAIQKKARYIDSMRGRYRHKLEMGGELLPTKNLFIIAKKLTTSLRIRLFRFFIGLLDLFYYRIWFHKVVPKLPLKRGYLWKIWIRTHELV